MIPLIVEMNVLTYPMVCVCGSWQAGVGRKTKSQKNGENFTHSECAFDI